VIDDDGSCVWSIKAIAAFSERACDIEIHHAASERNVHSREDTRWVFHLVQSVGLYSKYDHSHGDVGL